MKIIFINPDANQPNGVYSYGLLLKKLFKDLILLNLNSCEENNSSTPQVINIHPEKSHQQSTIINYLKDIYEKYPNENILILPNNGELSNLSAFKYVQSLKEEDLKRTRLIGIIHGDHSSHYSFFKKYGNLYSHLIAVSKTCQNKLIEQLPDKSTPVHFIKSSVPPFPLKSTQNKNNTLHILYVGRLEEPDKRVSRIPLIAATLSKRSTPFKLTVCGDGSQKNKLLEALGPFKKNVNLTGNLSASDLQKVMQSADILLLVSAFEGTPLSLLEGMNTGLCPVVMKIDSGISDIIKHEKNGIIVPQGDIEKIAEEITRLDQDRRLLQTLKINAKQTILAQHSPDQFKMQLNILIDNAFNQNPPKIPENLCLDYQFEALNLLTQRMDSSSQSRVLFGSGIIGKNITDHCLEKGLQINCIIDSNPNSQNQAYRNIPILKPEELINHSPDEIIIASRAFSEDIRAQIDFLFENSKDKPRIITLDSQ